MAASGNVQCRPAIVSPSNRGAGNAQTIADLDVRAVARNAQLRQATLEDALSQVRPEVVEDAKAAAALMAMNNVYYRFRHMVGRDEYDQKPARLRMQRLAQVATSKADFELFCLAVSAINGCETCIRSHERVVLEGGLSEDHVNDAVRIASTFHGVAVALEM